jgi:DNA-binding protein HU-beta
MFSLAIAESGVYSARRTGLNVSLGPQTPRHQIKGERDSMAAKPLSKSKIVGALSEKTGMTRKAVATFFEELFKLAVKECKGGAGKFVIPNIGRAVKAHRKARMGRNPQTGEAIKIKAKTVVRLRAAKAFKDAVLS